MIYHYLKLMVDLDSALVGSGEQCVPLIIYGMTEATYVT